MKPLPKEFFDQFGASDEEIHVSSSDDYETLVAKFFMMTDADFKHSESIFYKFAEALEEAAYHRDAQNTTVH